MGDVRILVKYPVLLRVNGGVETPSDVLLDLHDYPHGDRGADRPLVELLKQLARGGFPVVTGCVQSCESTVARWLRANAYSSNIFL